VCLLRPLIPRGPRDIRLDFSLVVSHPSPLTHPSPSSPLAPIAHRSLLLSIHTYASCLASLSTISLVCSPRRYYLHFCLMPARLAARGTNFARMLAPRSSHGASICIWHTLSETIVHSSLYLLLRFAPPAFFALIRPSRSNNFSPSSSSPLSLHSALVCRCALHNSHPTKSLSRSSLSLSL
jgi:hypothetical protein